MKILVAYDGSQPSRRALQWATQIQGRPDVTIIGVIQTLAGSEKIADAIDPGVDLADHHRQLKEAAETLAAAGITAQITEAAGNPAEEIITTADAGDYDLIIVGATGAHLVRRFLVGTVADRVVRHSTRPVLVVR
jgi:nucleotide-binding universal stress UspA family protein